MRSGNRRAGIRLSTVLVGLLLWTEEMAPAPTAARAAPAPTLDELWQEPANLARLDLYAGPGGADHAPRTAGSYRFLSRKTTGVNPGYDVEDPDGREWSVKLGEEAQAEVTVSRILWAMGYHQPANYYVARWTMTGQDAGEQGGARFRTDVDGWRPGRTGRGTTIRSSTPGPSTA